MRAAVALGAAVGDAAPEAAGEILASRVTELMRSLDVPNGLEAVGYTETDISALVEGTLSQHRLTKLSPIPAGWDELTALFRASLRIW
jgi:hydroxyacid-oxoacid transhydrogenase